jgi:hypothetical protein
MRKKRRKFAPVLLATMMVSTACEKKQQEALALPEVDVMQVVQKVVPATKQCVAMLNAFVNTQFRPNRGAQFVGG